MAKEDKIYVGKEYKLYKIVVGRRKPMHIYSHDKKALIKLCDKKFNTAADIKAKKKGYKITAVSQKSL